jgi:tetratricopeptide (TPR) repeat protein
MRAAPIRAAKAWRWAIRMRMNDLLPHNAYGQHQRGKLGEAARLCGEILRANPKHPDALCMRGLIHLQLGELANAAADEAIRHGMVPPGLHTNLRCLLQNLGRHADALAGFNTVMQAGPCSFEVSIQRVSLLALNDPRGALASFDKALTIQPRNAIALNHRAAASGRAYSLGDPLGRRRSGRAHSQDFQVRHARPTGCGTEHARHRARTDVRSGRSSGHANENSSTRATVETPPGRGGPLAE